MAGTQEDELPLDSLGQRRKDVSNRRTHLSGDSDDLSDDNVDGCPSEVEGLSTIKMRKLLEQTGDKDVDLSDYDLEADLDVGIDVLVGESESSDSDDPGNGEARKWKKPIVHPKKKAKLREGNGEGSNDEADRLLPPLPSDYSWIGRLPKEKAKPQWNPASENRNSPNYEHRSLCSLFVDMAQEPLKHLLIGTNKLGRSLYPHTWPELSLQKLLMFIGIIFHMDCLQLRNISLYWNKCNPDKFIQASAISKRQFIKWYRALRPYDPDSYSSVEKRTNKIYKVEEYLRISQLQMQRMRKPDHQHLSLDEEMATFKGRCGLIQIIKNKPRGEGLKYYALCDPRTGYIYSTILHSGTSIEFENRWGRIVAFCYKLLTGRPQGSGLANYLDQGFCVYTDSYYTTVHMNYAMTLRRTFFCGTLRREQRSSLPKEIMMGTRRDPISQEVKNLKRGEVLRRFSNYGETAAISWMDNTVVTFLTSIDESTGDPQIANRMKKSAKGCWFRLGVNQPSVAKDFSMHMGGVDVHDQLTTSVKAHHRSRRWYLSAVVLQSVDWFAANAAILYNDFNEKKIANCQVKELLADGILKFFNSVAEVTEPCREELVFNSWNPTDELPKRFSDVEIRRLRLNRKLPHYPRKYVGKSRECAGHCQRVTTSTFCSVCGIFLCDTGCFGRFHEFEKYLFNDVNLDVCGPIVGDLRRSKYMYSWALVPGLVRGVQRCL